MANANSLSAQQYAHVNGQMMPAAGHFSDMQTLMQSMDALSAWLEQNRQDQAVVQQGLAQLERAQQGRLSAAHPLVNGDSAPPPTTDPTPIEFRAALASAHNRLASLERTYTEQIRLQQLYEDTLADATDRIRQYCFEQQNHTLALHQHYGQQLAQARSETIEAQLVHQAWQAGLGRVSEGIREALKSREKEGKPWKKRVAALKEENRVLRKIAGWEPAVDSDEEVEEEEDVREVEVREDGRGRTSRGGNGRSNGTVIEDMARG